MNELNREAVKKQLKEELLKAKDYEDFNLEDKCSYEEFRESMSDTPEVTYDMCGIGWAFDEIMDNGAWKDELIKILEEVLDEMKDDF